MKKCKSCKKRLVNALGIEGKYCNNLVCNLYLKVV